MVQLCRRIMLYVLDHRNEAEAIKNEWSLIKSQVSAGQAHSLSGEHGQSFVLAPQGKRERCPATILFPRSAEKSL